MNGHPNSSFPFAFIPFLIAFHFICPVFFLSFFLPNPSYLLLSNRLYILSIPPYFSSFASFLISFVLSIILFIFPPNTPYTFSFSTAFISYLSLHISHLSPLFNLFCPFHFYLSSYPTPHTFFFPVAFKFYLPLHISHLSPLF